MSVPSHGMMYGQPPQRMPHPEVYMDYVSPTLA